MRTTQDVRGYTSIAQEMAAMAASVDERLIGIQDDYSYWAANNEAAHCAKVFFADSQGSIRGVRCHG